MIDLVDELNATRSHKGMCWDRYKEEWVKE